MFTFQRSPKAAPAFAVVAAAAIMLAVGNGTRSSWGLLIGPINSATGYGPSLVSLAVALAALAWGAAQPVTGALVQRIGQVRVLFGGGLLAAVALLLLPLTGSGPQFVVAMTLGGAAAAAAGSAPLLMGIVAQRVSVERRGTAMGVVSAGGSLGQLALAPLTATIVASSGWSGSVLAFGVLVLLATPLALLMRPPAETAVTAAQPPRGSWKSAIRTGDFWCVTGGFFVCGFHVTLLTTHMPGVIELCGLSPGFSGLWLAIIGACNVVGSIGIGMLMRHWPMKSLLTAIYSLRAIGVALFVMVEPTAVTLLIFALVMGMTFMATLPPTSGLIAQLFGARQVATLFGITMAMHQLGSALGAWLGGLEFGLTGSYHWVWALDIALAAAAALIHLPVRESRGERLMAATAADHGNR